MSETYNAARSTATSEPEFNSGLYREIFAHSNEPIAILNPQGHYLEQNTAHHDLLGYSDDELEGKTPAIHMGSEAFENIARELAEKGSYRGEVISHTKAGEIRHIEVSAFTTRDSFGNPICYVEIKRDISKRKLAEEALRRSEALLTDFFESKLDIF